ATRHELARFIEPDGKTRLRFRHAVVHGVAYRGLPYKRRRELHARAGEVVERLSADDPDSSAEFLAYHFSEAGAYEKAWRYSQVAAVKAKAAYANTAAATHYERALDAARHVSSADEGNITHAWIELGEVRELAGEMETAREALSQALRVGHLDSVTRADIYLRRAGTWMNTGNLTQAKRNVSLGKHELGSADEEDHRAMLAQLDAFESSIHAAGGDPEKASKAAHRAIALSREASADEAMARAFSVLDWANFMLGVEGEKVGPQAIEIYERLGFLERSVGVMNNLGAFAYFEGDWDRAVDWYQKSLEAADRSGNILEAALTKTNIAEVMIGQRRYSEAGPLLEDARRVYEASQADHYLPLVRLLRARLETASQPEVTTVSTLRKLFEAQKSGNGQWTNETAVALAEALLAVEGPEPAIEFTSDPGTPGSPGVTRVRIAALVAAQRYLAASEEIDGAISEAAESGDLLEELHLLEIADGLARRLGAVPEPADPERLAELRQRLGIVAGELSPI
ncbi:MAG: tetratricopeptide repeat protein, partial [Acidimicrobiia bacterium]